MATFILDVDGGGTAKFDPATSSGFTDVTLTDVGDSFTLVFTTTRGWVLTAEASGSAYVSSTAILTKS